LDNGRLEGSNWERGVDALISFVEVVLVGRCLGGVTV
jgi:hypothetical protein